MKYFFCKYFGQNEAVKKEMYVLINKRKYM